MGGRNYNLRMGEERWTFPDVLRERLATALIAARCARGEHRTETDAETGDEVCRFCGHREA